MSTSIMLAENSNCSRYWTFGVYTGRTLEIGPLYMNVVHSENFPSPTLKTRISLGIGFDNIRIDNIWHNYRDIKNVLKATENIAIDLMNEIIDKINTTVEIEKDAVCFGPSYVDFVGLPSGWNDDFQGDHWDDKFRSIGEIRLNTRYKNHTYNAYFNDFLVGSGYGNCALACKNAESATVELLKHIINKIEKSR